MKTIKIMAFLELDDRLVEKEMTIVLASPVTEISEEAEREAIDDVVGNWVDDRIKWGWDYA